MPAGVPFQTAEHTAVQRALRFGPLLGKRCSEGICVEILLTLRCFLINCGRLVVNTRQLCTQHPTVQVSPSSPVCFGRLHAEWHTESKRHPRPQVHTPPSLLQPSFSGADTASKLLCFQTFFSFYPMWMYLCSLER